jgi:hypothetical protein
MRKPGTPKQKIGSEINDYDTSVIYMINSIDRGGSLTNVRIPPGGRLKSMLLFIRPGEDTAEGKVTIIQQKIQNGELDMQVCEPKNSLSSSA